MRGDRGDSIRVVGVALGLDALVDLVATGRLIVVVGDSVLDRLDSDVAAVPVTGIPPTDLVLAWAADSHDARLSALLELATAPSNA